MHDVGRHASAYTLRWSATALGIAPDSAPQRLRIQPRAPRVQRPTHRPAAAPPRWTPVRTPAGGPRCTSSKRPSDSLGRAGGCTQTAEASRPHPGRLHYSPKVQGCPHRGRLASSTTTGCGSSPARVCPHRRVWREGSRAAPIAAPAREASLHTPPSPSLAGGGQRLCASPQAEKEDACTDSRGADCRSDPLDRM